MFNEEITVEEIKSSVATLDKDLRNAASTMTDDEARFLVDSYYQMQGNRIRSNNQIRQMEDEPHDILFWLSTQSTVLEKNVKAALNVYSNAHPIGQRIRTVVGIGEVIASGLVAHIDITKAPTAGAIWRFAGLDPTVEWKKKTKRPFNAQLKVLCWKLGESFVKVSGNDKAFYGKIYKERKELEVKRNDAGEFADQAENILEKKNIGKTTEAYKAYSNGKLPPAHVQARSTRYAVKLFLSHLHEVWYKHEYGKNPPNPFVLEHGGHAHKIEPPFQPKAVIETSLASEPYGQIETNFKSEPYVVTETQTKSEPPHSIETKQKSEPLQQIDTKIQSEPQSEIETRFQSEPTRMIETAIRSEPCLLIETSIASEPNDSIETMFSSEPIMTIETGQMSEPLQLIETKGQSEPYFMIETCSESEPLDLTETTMRSEPRIIIETSLESEPEDEIETKTLSEPLSVIETLAEKRARKLDRNIKLERQLAASYSSNYSVEREEG